MIFVKLNRKFGYNQLFLIVVEGLKLQKQNERVKVNLIFITDTDLSSKIQ